MKKHHLNILLFLIPLFLLGILNLFTPHKPAISQLENRTLKTKPLFTTEKLFSGEYFQEYEEYFADNFIFREKFVDISGKIKDLWRLPGKDKVTIVLNEGANVAAIQNKETSHGENDTSKTDTPSQTNNNDRKNEMTDKKNRTNIEGRVLVFNDCAMEIHTYNAEASKYYADFINQFQENLPNNKIKVYSLIAPTQIEFITESKYKNLSSPQKETIAYVNKHLGPQIIPVDAYQALQQNIDQYIYFRSDHHWTALGAYYAYTAFMETKSEKPLPIEQYKVKKVTPYLGSLYSTTLSQKIRENPDTVFLYQPLLKHEYIVYYENPIKIDLLDMRHAENKNKYGIFLGGDHPWGKITTEIKNGKKIIIIKDSYANAFVPFLLPHYEEIYIVDPRQFNLDIFTFIKENGIQEVLFLNYVLVTDNNGFTDLLRQMSNLP
ncbi:MAG TPA: hypothetical protein GX532_03255 [Clostridia bacterium]|jgi:hypothetical protein|nr:hypothetical protein [Clostridia bacterium]